MCEGVGVAADGVGGFVGCDGDGGVALGDFFVVARETDVGHCFFFGVVGCAEWVEEFDGVVEECAVEHGFDGE